MNLVHLSYICVACWLTSISLGFYATFRLARLVRDTSAIISQLGNPNITSTPQDLQALHDGIYYASRVEGVGTDVIFAVVCLYVFLCSCPYFTDWSKRFYGFCGHKQFWFGLALDAAGVCLCFEGFDQYGGQNPQNATSYISSGMTALALGSYLIIRKYEAPPLDLDRHNLLEGADPSSRV